MHPLITRSDIAQYRQISKTPHDDVLNAIILDAQMLDLQPLLGERLYNKIIATPADFAELLSGGPYDYQGTTYNSNGLKMVLCYFTYARYIMFSSVIDTPFSVVEKLNENSRPAEAASKKSIYTMNRDAAFQLWDNVKNYLVRTGQSDFSGCRSEGTPRNGFRITKIG